jgi:hypothetical protein
VFSSFQLKVGVDGVLISCLKNKNRFLKVKPAGKDQTKKFCPLTPAFHHLYLTLLASVLFTMQTPQEVFYGYPEI